MRPRYLLNARDPDLAQAIDLLHLDSERLRQLSFDREHLLSSELIYFLRFHCGREYEIPARLEQELSSFLERYDVALDLAHELLDDPNWLDRLPVECPDNWDVLAIAIASEIESSESQKEWDRLIRNIDPYRNKLSKDIELLIQSAKEIKNSA